MLATYAAITRACARALSPLAHGYDREATSSSCPATGGHNPREPRAAIGGRALGSTSHWLCVGIGEQENPCQFLVVKTWRISGAQAPAAAASTASPCWVQDEGVEDLEVPRHTGGCRSGRPLTVHCRTRSSCPPLGSLTQGRLMPRPRPVFRWRAWGPSNGLCPTRWQRPRRVRRVEVHHDRMSHGTGPGPGPRLVGTVPFDPGLGGTPPGWTPQAPSSSPACCWSQCLRQGRQPQAPELKLKLISFSLGQAPLCPNLNDPQLDCQCSGHKWERIEHLEPTWA
jgi:hypothetical protein